jgi:hypothetical protein
MEIIYITIFILDYFVPNRNNIENHISCSTKSIVPSDRPISDFFQEYYICLWTALQIQVIQRPLCKLDEEIRSLLLVPGRLPNDWVRPPLTLQAGRRARRLEGRREPSGGAPSVAWSCCCPMPKAATRAGRWPGWG